MITEADGLEQPALARLAGIDNEMAGLAERYRSADPYPHISIDDFFPAALVNRIRDEIASTDIDPEKNFYSTYLKRRISDFRRLPTATAQLVADLNSAEFLLFLERLTGTSGLIPDPYLEGGGIHQIGKGGYLKIHTDFNFHEKLKLHRRLNLLLYLNRDWKPEWGGALELWDDQVSACRASYLPTFNRMIIFSTTDTSYHGHPDPLACPESVTRNSIALYYYTAERPADEVRFAKSTLTNYQPRPNEEFETGRTHHQINQLEIRSPLFRRLMTWLRRLR